MGPFVAVVGPGESASPDELAAAETAGAEVALAGAVLVTGGLGGVMEAACRGARSELGMTIGFLPGDDREDANGWVTLAVPTGLGEMRNGLVVRCADAVVADAQRGGPRAQDGQAGGCARRPGARRLDRGRHAGRGRCRGAAQSRHKGVAKPARAACQASRGAA